MLFTPRNGKSAQISRRKSSYQTSQAMKTLLPKGENVSICDSTFNEQYMFSVANGIDRNHSMIKEDSTALHLSKKAERCVALSATVNVLMFPDFQEIKDMQSKESAAKARLPVPP